VKDLFYQRSVDHSGGCTPAVLAAFVIKGLPPPTTSVLSAQRIAGGAFMVANGWPSLSLSSLLPIDKDIRQKAALHLRHRRRRTCDWRLLPADTDITMNLRAANPSSFIIGFNSPAWFSPCLPTWPTSRVAQGRRATGLVFASAIFSTKAGVAIGAGIYGALLTFLATWPRGAVGCAPCTASFLHELDPCGLNGGEPRRNAALSVSDHFDW